MYGESDLLDDPALEENLSSALTSSALFNQQTLERVNAMKFLVLKAFEGDEHGAGCGSHPGQDITRRDITTKIVSLVEGRAEAVDQFKKAQDAAEMTFASLRRRLASLRTYVPSVSAQLVATTPGWSIPCSMPRNETRAPQKRTVRIARVQTRTKPLSSCEIVQGILLGAAPSRARGVPAGP